MRQVRKHDVFRSGVSHETRQIVDVQVFAHRRAAAVGGLDERAFGDQNICAKHVLTLEMRAPHRVTGVTYQRHFDDPCDLLALLFERHQFFLLKADEVTPTFD